MMSLPEIEAILLKLRLTKKNRELAVNIYYVLSNLKPGVLWDFGNVDIPKLLLLRCLISDLVIVVVDVDFFISSRRVILESLSNLLAEPPLFVDISRQLADPLPASPQVQEEQTTFLSHAINLITEATDSVVTLQMEAGWNLCSVFGMLLGFPVVYYTDTEEGNCLANVDLTLYRVMTDQCSSSLTSFSLPSRLEVEASDKISRWERGVCRVCDGGPGPRITRETVNLAVVVV